MTCLRCQTDPHPPAYLNPRKCAFQEGVFTDENWCCATMEALSEACVEAFHEDDERLYCLYRDLGTFFGIIVLQRYKWRGSVAGAIVFNTSAGGTTPLTLELAEKALLG